MTPTANERTRIIIMSLYIWIAIGSAIGGVSRYALTSSTAGLFGGTFPWGTLIINVTGSFLISFFATVTEAPEGRWPVSSNGRTFFMVGICGGYTTFSAFSLHTLRLAQMGEWYRAGGNIAGSVVFCLFAVWLGYLAGMYVNSSKGA
jgi:fluoride exporter